MTTAEIMFWFSIGWCAGMLTAIKILVGGEKKK